MTRPMRWFTLSLASVLGAGVVVVGAATPVAATFPGESGRVAYTEASEIYTMNPDGSDRRRVTFDGGVFVKRVMGPDGSEDDPYVNLYTWNAGPTWTPDGSQVAYLHYGVDDSFEIRLIDPIIGSASVLFSDWHGTMISWAPDGRRIAYGDDRGVWVADADGTDAVLVATPSVGLPWLSPGVPSSITFVKWSPDGRRLVFLEYTGVGMVAGVHFVGVIDADGSNRQSFQCTAGVSGLLDTIDWAPTGSTLLCGEMNGPMMTIAPDGSSLTVLADADHPVWSPDGSEILHGIGALYEDLRELWSYNVASGAGTRLLTEFWGYDLAWQPLRQISQPVGLVDPATGIWRLARGDGTRTSFYYGNPGDFPIMGDWDCDGIETPGLYRQSDGYVYLRNSNTQGNAHIRFYFGNPGDIPLAGDFDNDGCDTISIYRQTEGRVYVINKLGANEGGLGAAEYAYYFGNPGDKPFVGDFNGDGTDTVGLHRESTGLVYFRNSNTQGNAEFEFYFGDPGDRLIAGDWNRDGRDSPAVYRPSNTTFYFRYTNTQGNADEQYLWGQPRWLPVSTQTS